MIGRSASCGLLIDDMLASRVHARLTVTEDAVLLVDLDSTNGVYLNEARLVRPTPLRDGDRILIGAIELSYFVMDAKDAVTAQPQQRGDAVAQAPSGRKASPAALQGSTEMATHKAEILDRLGSLADRAFAEGRIEAAKRLLSEHLHGVLAGARSGRPIPDDVLRSVAEYGLKLAASTSDGAWIDLVVELHMIARRPLLPVVIAGLQALLMSLSNWDRELFQMYQAVLGGVAPAMSEVDRDLCDRICAMSARGPMR